MDELNQQARDYSPGRDVLVLGKDIRHGDGILHAGEILPTDGFTQDRLRQMIRTRFVTVMPGSESVTVASTDPNAIVCVDCGRTFRSKLNLGAHRRAHRKA